MYEVLTDTLGDASEVPCDHKMDFLYDECFSTALARELNKEFGCVVPFVRQIEGMNICMFNTTSAEGRAFKTMVNQRYSYLSDTGIIHCLIDMYCVRKVGLERKNPDVCRQSAACRPVRERGGCARRQKKELYGEQRKNMLVFAPQISN